MSLCDLNLAPFAPSRELLTQDETSLSILVNVQQIVRDPDGHALEINASANSGITLR